jgi:hypothetical protein
LAVLSDRTTWLTEPTRGTEVQILLIARRAVDDVFPGLFAIDFLVSGGSSRKVLQNLGSRATMPFWVGV